LVVTVLFAVTDRSICFIG